MTQEQKDNWLEQLRSGKYEQGKGMLRSNNVCNNYAYCCLGVAKYFVLGIDRDRYFDSEAFLNDNKRNGEYYYFLPEQYQQFLAGLNDSGGYPFERIADIVEEHIQADGYIATIVIDYKNRVKMIVDGKEELLSIEDSNTYLRKCQVHVEKLRTMFPA